MDYVYVPMGGSRMGPVRNAFNLVGVFTLSGLWHGAGWNFVLWGFVNGVAMYVYLLWSTRPGASTAPVALGSPRWWAGNFVTMHVFALALLIFRGQGLSGVWTTLHALVLNPWWIGYEGVFAWTVLVYAAPMMALDLWQTRARVEEPMLAWSRPAQGVLLGAALVWIAAMGGVDLDVPFVYFQF
jgi:alginate O-acetyltransferase complex protein AlgI